MITPEVLGRLLIPYCVTLIATYWWTRGGTAPPVLNTFTLPSTNMVGQSMGMGLNQRRPYLPTPSTASSGHFSFFSVM
jgi:hypothetical protein